MDSITSGSGHDKHLSVNRPLLRYFGGKFQLFSWISQYIPKDHRIYTESFGGAASVLLLKERCYSEVYNEIDQEISNVFCVVRNKKLAKELTRQLRLTPYSHVEFNLSYQKADDLVEQARRTIVRSFFGYNAAVTGKWNTGFRSNSKRSGSTPAHDWLGYPDALQAIIERLQGVTIEDNEPAIKVIKKHDSYKTLHYVDPPYPAQTRGKRWATNAYRHEMTNDDHRELAEILHSVKGMVLLSGYPCELYDMELFPDWKRITKVAYADGAKKRIEVLWLNNALVECLKGELRLNQIMFDI